MDKKSAAHKLRVTKELKAAGVTRYGMMKFVIGYLITLLHPDERIGGVVYGRYKAGSSLLTLNEGMLVATNRRVLFIDHKPGYTAFDELTYDVISGVGMTTAGFSGITLRTRLGDYVLRFVNGKAAHKFVRYIEAKRIENANGQTTVGLPKAQADYNKTMAVRVEEKTIKFLQDQELGVLSTIDRTGNLHGAVVYYLTSDDGILHILTKSDTQKVHDTLANHQVALTVYDQPTMRTAQVQGLAEIEADQVTKDFVFTSLAKPRQYGDSKHMPPVTQLEKGAFIVIRITPTNVKFTDYKQTAE